LVIVVAGVFPGKGARSVETSKRATGVHVSPQIFWKVVVLIAALVLSVTTWAMIEVWRKHQAENALREMIQEDGFFSVWAYAHYRRRIDAGTVDTLSGLLAGPDSAIRWRTATALGMLGPDGARALPGLLRALKDEDARVRFAAADALSRMMPAAQGTIPTLTAVATNDTSYAVRVGAREAVYVLEGAEEDEKARRRTRDQTAEIRKLLTPEQKDAWDAD
jgi:hypothetical protein